MTRNWRFWRFLLNPFSECLLMLTTRCQPSAFILVTKETYNSLTWIFSANTNKNTIHIQYRVIQSSVTWVSGPCPAGGSRGFWFKPSERNRVWRCPIHRPKWPAAFLSDWTGCALSPDKRDPAPPKTQPCWPFLELLNVAPIRLLLCSRCRDNLCTEEVLVPSSCSLTDATGSQ